MNLKSISELISVVTIGTLCGLGMHGTQVKYQRLGREAWLSDKSRYFDKYIANPASVLREIFIFVVLALLIFVLYKVLAFVAAKILFAFSGKSATEQS
jgi:hypothetical protein